MATFKSIGELAIALDEYEAKLADDPEMTDDKWDEILWDCEVEGLGAVERELCSDDGMSVIFGEGKQFLIFNSQTREWDVEDDWHPYSNDWDED